MPCLIKLSTSRRTINILEESSVEYRGICTLLLNDKYNVKLRAIEQKANNEPVEAIRMIYERWMREGETHSWKELTKCFRDVQLNRLASMIEEHFKIQKSEPIHNRHKSAVLITLHSVKEHII